MKKLFYIPLLFGILLLLSCSKEEEMQENEVNNVPEELHGKWYSQVPEDGFYEIEFTPQGVRFTISAGTPQASTQEWPRFHVENHNTLSIRRFDEHYQQNADFKLPFALSDDGRLWIDHLAPSIAAVIGQYPGDRSWYGDIWFGRDKKQEFPKNDR